MNKIDSTYLSLIEDILKNGIKKSGRNGDTISVFGRTMKFGFEEGFPILTTKKVHFHSIVAELLWFLKGDTHLKFLHDNNVHIWDGDAYAYYTKQCVKEKIHVLSKQEFFIKLKNDSSFYNVYGDLGPIYGKQWRKWEVHSYFANNNKIEKQYLYIDQIKNLILDLKDNPDSRRLIISAWNPVYISNEKTDIELRRYMTLPPCHFACQFYTQKMTLNERIKLCEKENIHTDFLKNVPMRKISCLVHIRSNDFALGAPFNISSYALFLSLIAKEVNMIPNELIYEIGDCHIYCNQMDAINIQLKRKNEFKLPKLFIEEGKQILDYESNNFYQIDDIKLIGYEHEEAIKMPLSN